MNKTSERILAIIEDTGEYDPHIITEKVIGGLKRTEYAGALEDSLPTLVRVVLGNLRSSSHPGQTQCDPQSLTAGVGTPSDDAMTAATPGGPARRRGRSSYARWTGLFSKPYGTANGYKALGELTREDVRFIIADRTTRGTANFAEADRFKKIDGLMGKRKAGKVGDLPEDVVGGCFQ